MTIPPCAPRCEVVDSLLARIARSEGRTLAQARTAALPPSEYHLDGYVAQEGIYEAQEGE